jgi:ABC-type multidrug transport system fused ATPase/permease subunit
LVSSLQNEIELTQRSFVSFFTAITELFITFTIGAALILFSFKSTLAAGAIFGIAVVVYEVGVQKKIVKLGTDLSIQAPQLLKQLIQGFQGIKEIKTYNREQIFFDEFENHHHETLLTRTRYQWYVRFPALWYEFFSIVALAAALLVIANETTNNDLIISKIGLLVFACFRLVPALNRISIGLNDLRYSSPAIASVLVRTKTDCIQKSPQLQSSFRKSISFEEVSFRYEPEMDLVINRSSLVINKGDSIQIVGASGSGKSTFLDILLGLLAPESGEILLDGQPMDALASIMPSLVSYVSQNVYMTDDTIRANIVFGRNEPILDEHYLNEILNASQLTEFIGTLPDGLNTKVGEFGSNISGGQRQRIGIARALMRNSEILIFDESTNALDSETEALLLKSLMNYAANKTIIWISHNNNSYQYFSRIVQIENGQFREVNRTN